MKIGVFGGTFNPIHLGHLRIAEEALEAIGLDRVLFIPAGTPPLKNRDIAPAVHRLRMAELAVSGSRRFSVLDVECAKPEKSFTVKTLELLRETYPKARLCFITGIDAFLDIPNWWQPRRLLQLAQFVVVSRPHTRFADLIQSPFIKGGGPLLRRLDSRRQSMAVIPLTGGGEIIALRATDLDISSTAIRTALRAGRSVKYLLPPKVESYIILNKLYGNPAAASLRKPAARARKHKPH